jgi:diguanylate cyclase (GGDEF)-like protein
MSAMDDQQRQELARSELQKAQLVITSDAAEALAHLQRAEQLDAANTMILLLLARTQLRLARIVDAVNTLERLLKMEPGHREALGLLAYGQRQLGHFDLAKDRAEEALALDAGDRTALEVRADCLAVAKDYQGALGDLDRLVPLVTDEAAARVKAKAAFCHLKLGHYRRSLTMTAKLIEKGFDSELISGIYHQAQDQVKAEIASRFEHMTWWQRVYNRITDRALLDMHLEDTQGMDGLRQRSQNAEATVEVVKTQAQEHERRADEAARLANTDQLTGLPNRTCFNGDWIPRIQAQGSCAFLAFDLDKFKLVNDLHGGHDAGDKALVKTARIGSQVFRHPEGNLFRFGGEEFIAVLFEPAAEVQRQAEDFRARMETQAAAELAREGLRLRWPGPDGRMVDRPLTASVGIAFWPQDAADLKEAMKLADVACYVAKQTGRNRVVTYQPGMTGKPAEAPTPEAMASVAAPPKAPAPGSGRRRRVGTLAEAAPVPAGAQGQPDETLTLEAILAEGEGPGAQEGQKDRQKAT